MDNDSAHLQASIVRDIMKLLDVYNPYAANYRVLHYLKNNFNHPTLKMKIFGKRERDGRRYNLPTASEVAMLIVGDFNATDMRCNSRNSIWIVQAYHSL